MSTVLALDLGSSSGRLIAGYIAHGTIHCEEISRFHHHARLIDGIFQWDIDSLWENITRSLTDALARFPDAHSLSIDTWGVDYVALDSEGNTLGPAVAYRDERTERTREDFRSLMCDREFFSLTGIAPATINTANQLFAYLREDSERAKRTSHILFSPDYWAYRLTGVKGWTRTIASTSGLCMPGGRQWNEEVFTRLGIPRTWVGDIQPDLSVIGQCTFPGLEQLTLVRAGAHDTACAVHGLPVEEGKKNFFLSCGSWAVIGARQATPVLSDQAFDAGLTNEACSDGSIRPLFNLTGMWILQELQREWQEKDGKETPITELVARAQECAPSSALIDPDSSEFAKPGSMEQKIHEAYIRAGGRALTSRGAYVRLVLESFASRYAQAISQLSQLCGTVPDQVNIVGGGSRNQFLCQEIANIAKISIVSGPSEASTFGSVLAQLEIAGEIDAARRYALITQSADSHVYQPR